MHSDTNEPPRKKRRSKWGVKPEGVGEEDPAPQGPKGAEAAAAKLNAMLAAQGKLAKSDPPQKPLVGILLSRVHEWVGIN